MSQPVREPGAGKTSPSSSRDPADFERSWRIVTVAGLLGMTYYSTCIFGAPRTKFLVELNATEFDFGLLAGLGSFSLAFQLISGMIVNRMRRRKPAWMVLFIAHRLVYLGVLAAPWLFQADRPRIWWIIGVVLVHNVLVNMGDPMWFSWMTDLVPDQAFNRHWARRQRFMSGTGIVVGLAVALVFRHFELTGQVVRGFVIVGSCGVFLGIVDICLFSLVPEPDHQTDVGVPLLKALAEPVVDHDFRRFLVFLGYWYFAVWISAPFFQLYLIREMGFSVLAVQMVVAAHGLGIVVAAGRWGRVCDSHGFRPVLQLFVACKFVVPLVYVLVPGIPWLALPIFIATGFMDGVVNSAGFLALQGVTLRCTPRRNRAMYVAVANFVSMGLAGGIAPLIAGSLIRPLTGAFSFTSGPYHVTGFHLIFAASVLLRLGGLPLVTRLREPDSKPVGELIAHLRAERPFWMWHLR